MPPTRERRNKRETQLDKQYEDSLKSLYSGKEPSDGMPPEVYDHRCAG